MIERIDGRPQYADAEITKHRKAGHSSEYLFAARNEQEFERKKQAEIAETLVVSLAMIMRDEFVNPFAQRALADVDHAPQTSAVSPTLAQHRQAYSGTQP
jgi:hypothetical protein